MPRGLEVLDPILRQEFESRYAATQRATRSLFTTLFPKDRAMELRATYLGRADSIGSITAGKQADLVVLRGNRVARIEDIENVELVFKQGVAYDPAKLIASVAGRVGLF